MNSLLYFFRTFKVCGLRDCMINTAAFRPPSEGKYEVILDKEDDVKGPVYRMILKDFHNLPFYAQDLDGLESSIVWLDTKTHKKIPALFIENKECTSDYVILYSHGNCTDLGRMYKSLQELSKFVNAHVFAYEYNGYGPTTGKVGEYELIFGIIAAYEFLTQRLGFKWQNIVLYGRSIGSGPSVYLASHPDYPVSGVILHSPIASGLRLLKFEMEETDDQDLFPNCDFIKYVRAQVFIMHGEADNEVPITHGKLLASKCKNLYKPWWVTGGTHNDIDYSFKRAYFLRISKFLRFLQDFNEGKSEQEIEEFYKVTPWWHESSHVYLKMAATIEESYKMYLMKNEKEVSCAPTSLTASQKVQAIREEPIKKYFDDGEDKEIENFGIEPSEGRASVPLCLPSKDVSQRLKKNTSDFESCCNSFSLGIKEIEIIRDLRKQGPRQVKFKSTKILPKNELNLSITNIETTDRVGYTEDYSFKGLE